MIAFVIAWRALFGVALLVLLAFLAIPIAVFYIHFLIRRRTAPDEPSAYSRFVEKHPIAFDIQMYTGNFPALEDKFRLIPPLRGSVLQIACGTGFGTRVMARHGAQFVNLDINRNNLEYGRKRGRLADFVHGDAYDLPFAEKQFDHVVIPYAFHHFQKPEGLFRECRRVLKDSGTLVIFDLVSLRDRPLKWWNIFNDGFIWSYDTRTIRETVSSTAARTSLVVKSIAFSRPRNLLGYNVFYPCTDYVAQISPVRS